VRALDEQRYGAELGGVLELRARRDRQRTETIDLLVATLQRLSRSVGRRSWSPD
jgi:hypothetical protein